MPYRPNYPATVREVLDPNMTFKPAALRAVQAFARGKPWRGNLARRRRLFHRLNRALADAYGIATPRLVYRGAIVGSSYCPPTHTITLAGRLSVVTYLHEFAHARGADERRACRWSINLFRRCFPRSFSNCQAEGHRLVRRTH